MKTASGAQDTPKTVALSATSCNFNVPSNENLYAAARSSAATVVMSATPGATPGASFNGLVGGQTYYLNISNKVGSTNMCSGTCDVLLTVENASP
jgi:hypothetical protein